MAGLPSSIVFGSAVGSLPGFGAWSMLMLCRCPAFL